MTAKWAVSIETSRGTSVDVFVMVRIPEELAQKFSSRAPEGLGEEEAITLLKKVMNVLDMKERENG